MKHTHIENRDHGFYGAYNPGKDISNHNENELTEYRADTVYYQKNYIEKFGIINLSS